MLFLLSMENKDFNELFEEYYRTKDKNILDEIYLHLVYILEFIVREDYKKLRSSVKEELISIGYEYIQKVILSYDIKQGHIIPYFIKRLHWEFHKYLDRKQDIYDREISLETGYNTYDNSTSLKDSVKSSYPETFIEEYVEDFVDRKDKYKKVREAFIYLTPLERKIIILRYSFFTDYRGDKLMPLDEIADILGYETHSMIIKSEKKALEKIKRHVLGIPQEKKVEEYGTLNIYRRLPYEEKLKIIEKIPNSFETLDLFLGVNNDPIDSPNEIAKILNKNPSTVKNHIRALRKEIYTKK